ncbi:MAG: ABC transporter substrate-binding protein [Bacteriovoracaceae bacterium]|nr:ABC transporter substrate-binding protein [Bacteriovoracaceae bacterium]
MKKFFSSLLLLILIGCSGVSIITGNYSSDFLKNIEEIKAIYKQGDNTTALNRLEKIKDANINPSEKSMKYNLMGVIYFSDYNYQTAISHFNQALKTADDDTALKAQIKLNLASSYFKLSNYRESFQFLQSINYKVLSEKEAKKHHHLSYVLAQQLQNTAVATKALILLTSDAKTFQDVRNSPFSEALLENFNKITETQRMRVLEDFQSDKFINIAFLGKLEVERQYYSGNKSEAKSVLGWLKSNYEDSDEVKTFVDDFLFRIDNYSKLDRNAIGIVLPLSGDKGSYGKKALRGIDAALVDLTSNTQGGLKINQPVIYTKDSYNSSIVGSIAVRELVEKHFVSVIIGGLYSESAKQEYLEAKKYGVVYVSLSPIYLPKDEKNHLLIEVPGSVESQVASAFSPAVLEKFGNKVAVLYPESDGGHAYINEIWRQVKANKVELKSINSYEKNVTDYRDPVEKLLGIKFKRERLEEYDLWADIYKLEGKTTVRRVQTLSPVIDFDWVFLPSYPHEAVQIIPAFNYYDANNLQFIGGPSWRSRSLVKEQKDLGRLNFIGDDPSFIDPEFRSRYFKRYAKSPKLIETLAYDAFHVGHKIIQDSSIQNRDQLETNLKNRKTIQSLSGVWEIKEGIWIKDMSPLKMENGKVVKLFKSAGQSDEAISVE